MKLMTAQHAISSRARSAWPAYGLAGLLFVTLLSTTAGFLNPVNLINIVNQQVTLSFATIGQAFVVMIGGLDLSVGSVISMTTAILALDLPASVVTPLAILAALLVGGINATGIIYFRVHPILMTLGSLTVVKGIALLLRPVPGGEAPAYLTGYSQASLMGLPLPVLLLVVVVIGATVILGRTKFGTHVLATGGSAESAELGGVRVNHVIAACYLISALMACLGGFNLAGRIASGDPLVGDPFSLDSVAATALGGTLLSGGVGSIGGPLAGVAILALLSNGLNLWNVSAYYQMLVKGVLLVLAVSAHRRAVPGL